MTEIAIISLFTEKLASLINKAVNDALTSHTAAIEILETKVGTSRYAYTLSEVAERIGYKVSSIRSFVKKGRRGRNGNLVRLNAIEITAGDFRVRPADLDDFLSQF